MSEFFNGRARYTSLVGEKGACVRDRHVREIGIGLSRFSFCRLFALAHVLVPLKDTDQDAISLRSVGVSERCGAAELLQDEDFATLIHGGH